MSFIKYSLKDFQYLKPLSTFKLSNTLFSLQNLLTMFLVETKKNRVEFQKIGIWCQQKIEKSIKSDLIQFINSIILHHHHHLENASRRIVICLYFLIIFKQQINSYVFITHISIQKSSNFSLNLKLFSMNNGISLNNWQSCSKFIIVYEANCSIFNSPYGWIYFPKIKLPKQCKAQM